jgi:hypothetical protein
MCRWLTRFGGAPPRLDGAPPALGIDGVIFEVTALDLGPHTKAGVLAFRRKLAVET